MAVVVEHDKRRHEILDKSLDIFMEEGYEDVTYQKIADRCGITRTTLYIYFKNKREIFIFSIKQLTQELELALRTIIEENSLSCSERLSMIFDTVIKACYKNRRLLNVILSYLLQLQKMGKDPGVRVRRRTLRLRHLLSQILIEGMNKGEFKKLSVKSLNEMFYALIESSIYRLAILDSGDVEDLRPSIALAIESLCQK
jgi:AcrR family transcriptional regulator